MLEKKGKKRWIVVGIVAVLVIVIVIGLVAGGSKQKAPQSEGTVEKITKRTIANSITGNGVVESADKQDVTGGSYGMTVSSVNVAVGDIVAEGDVICSFDTDDIDTQIRDLQERISETEAERATQNADYDERMTDATNSRTEQLETATENKKKAEDDLKEAKAELKSRKKKYDKAVKDAKKKGEK